MYISLLIPPYGTPANTANTRASAAKKFGFLSSSEFPLAFFLSFLSQTRFEQDEARSSKSCFVFSKSCLEKVKYSFISARYRLISAAYRFISGRYGLISAGYSLIFHGYCLIFCKYETTCFSKHSKTTPF
jgi:hypothetical protein